jgi:16S rRNA (cytidine1402-2'-O)-methyltransferase
MQEMKISSPEVPCHVFLVPSPLDENATETIPSNVLESVLKCSVIFAENERTARRFLKKIDKNIVIDDFEWHTISKEDQDYETSFREKIREKKNIAVISEAGCPGIADPGQSLVAIAHEMNATVHPLTGPVSPMLALMASGMNGQHFEFVGYLPIEKTSRIKALKELESDSLKRNSTKIFIETPYRNNQMLETILENCGADTLLCVAANLTGADEKIISRPVIWWKNQEIDLHKRPAIFLIHAGDIRK